jgi:hypothetical protein
MLAQRRLIFDQEDARFRQGRCEEVSVVHFDRNPRLLRAEAYDRTVSSAVYDMPAGPARQCQAISAAPHARLGRLI